MIKTKSTAIAVSTLFTCAGIVLLMSLPHVVIIGVLISRMVSK
jgi:hypothetical protein